MFDDAFLPLRLFAAGVEQLFTGLAWAEGPVWFGDGRYLLWSDIPNNRIMKWEEETGAVSEYRKPSGFANGHTRDRQGRLITCEHATRRVSRTEADGSVVALATHYQGKTLNSPNDVVVRSDGSIYFTDPDYGRWNDWIGCKREFVRDFKGVYRIPPGGGTPVLVVASTW